MKQGIQSFFKKVGEEGCLLLCMVEIAERITGKVIGPLITAQAVLDKGWIEPDMYVSKPVEIMEYLCGGKWEYIHSTKPGNNMKEYTIERWERRIPSGNTNHFKLPDWDSLENSQTVKYGKIVSYRILRRIK